MLHIAPMMGLEAPANVTSATVPGESEDNFESITKRAVPDGAEDAGPEVTISITDFGTRFNENTAPGCTSPETQLK